MQYRILRFTLITVLFVGSIYSHAQTNIQLILKGSDKISKVYAQDFSFIESLSADYKDTVNFNFTKTNNINLYTIGCYINDKQPWYQIWLDSGNVIVHAHIDSFGKFKVDSVINSPFYDYVKDFYSDFSKFYKTPDRDTAQFNKTLLTNLRQNINNPFYLWIAMLYLNINQNNKASIYVLKDAVSIPGDKFSWFRQYPDVIDRINSILSIEHIDFADYKFITTKNKETVLGFKNAEYHILDFWFLGCAPCRQEHKLISKKLVALRKNKIEVIGISTDRFSKEWNEYLSKNHYSWSNYLQANNDKITTLLGINSFPYYVVVNNKGDIIGRYNSFSAVLTRFNIAK